MCHYLTEQQLLITSRLRRKWKELYRVGRTQNYSESLNDENIIIIYNDSFCFTLSTSLQYKWISVYIIIISICFGLESSSQTKPYCQCCYWRFTSGSAEEPTNYIVCRYSSGNANARRMNRVQVRPSCLSNQDKHSIHAPVI